MRVLLPPGCGEPTPLIDEVVRQAERLRPLTLMGGLHLGGHPFCAPEHHGRLRWVTFHAMPALRDALARDQAEFVPLRYFDAPWAFGPAGPWAADAVLVQTAPPDGAGRLSLGVSTSYPLPVARTAPLVIAEVNQRMPRTLGDSTIALDRVGAWVETDRPLVPYASPTIGEVERRIAAHVAEIVPDGATIQVGIGATPEAVVSGLGGHRDLGVHSALFDAMLPLLERGVITGARNRRHPGCLDLGEIMGTEPLFRWVHENPRVYMEPSTTIHDPRVVAEPRAIRLDQLGDRDRSDGAGERGGARRAPGGGDRGPVRLRGGSGPRREPVGDRAAVDGPARGGLAHRGPARGRDPGHDTAPPGRLRRDRVRARRAARAQRRASAPASSPASPTPDSARGSSASGGRGRQAF